MTDVIPSGGGDPNFWQGVFYLVISTGVALVAEYIRRLLPPPRKRHEDAIEEEEK